MDNTFVREIEVYENERYMPLSGWSSKGLMLTDRSAYSTEDGSSNFSNLDDAGTQLTSEGWSPKPDCQWTVDLRELNVDEEGWGYATDFGGGPETFRAEKGVASFVRRRKMKRFMTFNPDFLCSDVEKMTCDNTDLEKVAEVSQRMLDALIGNSIKKHPRQISETKINLVKNALIAALALRASPVGVSAVLGALDIFSTEGSSAFSVMSAAVGSTSTMEVMSRRFQQCNGTFFPQGEREALARTIIRKHDREHLYHCEKINCGSDCLFAATACPNPDCEVVFSKCWGPKHDSTCPRKVVDCDRVCGERMPRMSVENHMEHACPLRPVLCPFSVFGCMADLVSKALPDHMENCTQSHLLLSLNRTIEHQHVMQSLNTKVIAMESQCISQSAQVKTLTAAVAASVVAVEISEKRVQKQISEEVSKSDAKLVRKVEDSTAELNRELAKINRALAEINAREKEKEKAAAAAAVAAKK